MFKSPPPAPFPSSAKGPGGGVKFRRELKEAADRKCAAMTAPRHKFTFASSDQKPAAEPECGSFLILELIKYADDAQCYV